jgi:PIN domain nuclease of toxin-antitoxin system
MKLLLDTHAFIWWDSDPSQLSARALAAIHKDPFDRVLIAQAIVEGAELVSADHVVRQYPVRVLW